jgi:predicted RNA polymerase sigma factor
LIEPLEQAVRQGGARIIAVLAARFRDLDLAEDAFSEACMRAAEKLAERRRAVRSHRLALSGQLPLRARFSSA